jgi:rhodanese-related sulfurtransferase
MQTLSISPELFLRERELTLLDIRPPEERWGEYGFIPGSLSAPMEEPWTRLQVPEDILATTSGLVLVCLSGARAKLAVRASPQEKPVFILEGGTMAWSAQGLPLVCRSEEVIEGASSFHDLHHLLRSCFLAEWIESSLNQGVETISDPVALFELCFKAEQVTEASCRPEALRRVLDRLARLSLRVGTEPVKVASNLSVMLNTIDKTFSASY